MKNLKEQLLKAGFRKSDSENERTKKQLKTKSANVKHQTARNFCDCCKKTTPDVEFYQHRNALVDAKWLCCFCADEYKIHDDCRQTVQSDFSRRKRFLRQYGPTKRFTSSSPTAPKYLKRK